MGYQTTVAADGVEALKALMEMQSSGTPCDLLLCDIQMPGMNGETLIETMKSKGIDIPVLVISGYGSKSLIVRLMRLGCDDFIDKPFDPEVLQDRIEKVLQSAEQKQRMRSGDPTEKYMERTQQIVHDINNLLGIAVGYTDMALDDLIGLEEVRSKLSTAVASSRKASEICDQFLSLVSAITSEKVRTNLNILVHRVVALFKEIIPSDISLLSVIPSTHLWVDGDADRIQQALLNLGLNALDAMPNGGKLCIELSYNGVIEAPAVEETAVLNSIGNCRISVSDTGDGIDPSILNRIYEKGFTTKSNGNGIGLFAVKQIAEEHDGEVFAENTKDGGACFRLMLPLAAVQSKVSFLAKTVGFVNKLGTELSDARTIV
jgi:signal transduction histidine kinase